MKLIPKAKPVKIRIMSGGKEHSSIDSLRRHFDIDDVKMLLDGRLARWLRQQGRNDLAASVSEFSCEALDSKEGCLEFMKIFFGENLFDKECSSLSELVSYWFQNKKRYTDVWSILLYNLLKLDKNEAITIYNNFRNSILSPEHWFSIFSYLQKSNENDADLLYILGYMLYHDVNADKHPIGWKYIEKAAGLGNKFAKVLTANLNTMRFPNISGQDKQCILEHIDDFLSYRIENLLYLRRKYSNPEINKICDFAEECHKALLSKSILRLFDFILSLDSLFYKEAFFIIYFLDNKNNLNDLKEIAPFYPPANWLIENKDSGKTFKGIRSDICFDKASPRRVVEFVFAHIFEY